MNIILSVYANDKDVVPVEEYLLTSFYWREGVNPAVISTRELYDRLEPVRQNYYSIYRAWEMMAMQDEDPEKYNDEEDRRFLLAYEDYLDHKIGVRPAFGYFVCSDDLMKLYDLCPELDDYPEGIVVLTYGGNPE